MDVSFDVINTKGDRIMVALSYYDYESVGVFTTDPSALSLVFYDVTLIQKSGEGYVGYSALYAVSDTLAKFMKDNDDVVLCFYCDAGTDLRRSHTDMLPQEYRSRLFSRMFDSYTKLNKISDLINHRVVVEDPHNPLNTQFAHFICRIEHQRAVADLGRLLMQK